MDDELAQFLAMVERAPLTQEEKEEMSRAAENGVDKTLWRRLDDMIVASLEMRKVVLREYREALDAETKRVTEEHESQVAVLDAKLRSDIESAGEDGAECDRIWAGYYAAVHALQGKLLDDLRESAAALKRQAVTRVSRGGTA